MTDMNEREINPAALVLDTLDIRTREFSRISRCVAQERTRA